MLEPQIPQILGRFMGVLPHAGRSREAWKFGSLDRPHAARLSQRTRRTTKVHKEHDAWGRAVRAHKAHVRPGACRSVAGFARHALGKEAARLPPINAHPCALPRPTFLRQKEIRKFGSLEAWKFGFVGGASPHTPTSLLQARRRWARGSDQRAFPPAKRPALAHLASRALASLRKKRLADFPGRCRFTHSPRTF